MNRCRGVGAHTLGLALALAVACSKGSVGLDAGTPAADAPVTAPPGLLAEARVSDPDAAWVRLQSGVRGALALLPPHGATLVCAWAGLDDASAAFVDGHAPAYAVFGEGPGTELAWVMAWPADDARR